METTRLSSNGQVIIPRAIRESRHWGPGTELFVEESASGILLVPRKPFSPTRVEDGIGCSGYKGPPKSLEEMAEGVATAIRKEWRRGKKR